MPQKFLWPGLLDFWRTKSPQVISDCVDVMSKIDILADPGPLMTKLVDIFAQRSLLVKHLSRADHNNITPKPQNPKRLFLKGNWGKIKMPFQPLRPRYSCSPCFADHFEYTHDRFLR